MITSRQAETVAQCFHRLLIEARLFISFNEISIGSYRYKDLLIVAVLLGNQPFQ